MGVFTPEVVPYFMRNNEYIPEKKIRIEECIFINATGTEKSVRL